LSVTLLCALYRSSHLLYSAEVEPMVALGAGACHPPALNQKFILLHGRFTLPVVTLVYFSSTALSITTAPLYSASNHPSCCFFLSRPDVADALDDTMSLTISRLTIFLLLFISLLLSPNTTRAQQFLYPPTIPLAVRSPYLNCWLQYNKTFTTSFGHTWPTTSNHSQVCHPHIFYWP
jgi:hypothetical protein